MSVDSTAFGPSSRQYRIAAAGRVRGGAYDVGRCVAVEKDADVDGRPLRLAIDGIADDIEVHDRAGVFAPYSQMPFCILAAITL